MRVVLAEDLYLLRTGLEKLLAAHGFDVIEAVDSGPALLDALVRGGGGG
jgi:DNA-binding NarL/FixJ family response regulator